MKRAQLTDQEFLNNKGDAKMVISHKRETSNQKEIATEPFFNEAAIAGMVTGILPDLSELKGSLEETISEEKSALSATDFLPTLRNLQISESEIEAFLKNPETNHVLVQNDLIKIVLIRWDAGASSNIHGHAIGGCVLKVLRGVVEEQRFSADASKTLLSKNTYFKDSIAYIDDYIGLHSVCNATDEPAVTLHMYTPGFYKPLNY